MPPLFERMPQPIEDALLFVARLLLSGVFVHEGSTLAVHLGSAVSAMGKLGVPSPLAVATIVLQIGAGLAVALGWQTRAASLLLGLFCVLTAALFHNDFTVHDELLHFEKDLAIAGGLGVLLVCGPGRHALEALQRPQTAGRGSPAAPSSRSRQGGAAAPGSG